MSKILIIGKIYKQVLKSRAMDLKGKAFFNLLKMNLSQGQDLKVQPWQLEDFSAFTVEELFKRLEDFGISLDAESFRLYAEECGSPEELVECLVEEATSEEETQKIYLLLFELYKRLLPGAMPLSVFCDELDHLIYAYDAGSLENEDFLQSALVILEDILDDSSDFGGSPQEIFKQVSSYCAHDLERFLFDFILDQIENGNWMYASELIDDFYDYVGDKRRFDFLRADLLMANDPEAGNLLFERLLDTLVEEPELELLVLVADSLIHRGDIRLFLLAIREILPLLSREEQFQEVVAMAAECYRCLDREEEEQKLTALLEERRSKDVQEFFSAEDPVVKRFTSLLKALPI